MLYLNIRHQLPTAAARSQPVRLERAVARPAELHATNRLPRTEVHPTGGTLSINTYPSRRAYGFASMPDVMAGLKQKGEQSIAAFTSERTQAAWDVIDNGAKQHQDYQAQKAKQKLHSELMEQKKLTLAIVPNPEIHWTQGEVEGEVDKGDISVDIQTKKDGADISWKPGSFEGYLKDRGYLRMWTSEGHYDVYA